ncbi:MAG TPA: C39 family peptidase [Syntrophomonadaceae bacterium]|nr:C39 family peptidase [Syntrophomonadaceae bacterium]
MARIMVNMAGMQDLKTRFHKISDETSNLEADIARAMNRLNWEASEKEAIRQQISRARGKATKLHNRSDALHKYVSRAIVDFGHTDSHCASKAHELSKGLENIWKQFLTIQSRVIIGLLPWEIQQMEAWKKFKEMFGDKQIRNPFMVTPIDYSIMGSTLIFRQHIIGRPIKLDERIQIFTASNPTPPLDGILGYSPNEYSKDVETLQKELNKKGYGPLDEDGLFGPKTLAAVDSFKDHNNLGNTGEYQGKVGSDTWAVLHNGSPLSETPTLQGLPNDTPQAGAGGVSNPVYFSQEDSQWSAKSFSNHNDAKQTIGATACGPTSMAMVVSTLTGKTVEPPTLCDYALDNGYRTFNQGTAHSFFGAAAGQYGLECTQTNSLDQVKAALGDGKHMVVAAMKPGHFTSEGHFIVMYGAENNNGANWYDVLDPNMDNRRYGQDGLVMDGTKNDGRVMAKDSVFRSEASTYFIISKPN